jgi:RNA polymerase sigma factor (sigma-70 family)
MQDASAVAVPAGGRRSARLLRLASDERLVALVRSGDEAAFEALYDRHHAAILGFCRHMLGTREEAEDAFQHTFLAAFREIAGSSKPIELRPWLFTIARNRCLSLLRMRRPHVALELAEPATDGLSATVERREDVRELLADVARLPADQRVALLLAELGALDHAGIAAVLGCPREKVKALVFQARSSLAASREARATPCEQIRIELATASGGALRRGPLRRHLHACAGCRTFKAQVAAQRGLLALALPVVPSVALKASVLAAAGAGATGGAASAAAAAGAGGAGTVGGAVPGATSGAIGGVLGTVASTGAAKVAVTVAVAGAVAGGGALTARHADVGAGPVGPAAKAVLHAHLSTPPASSAPATATVPLLGRGTPSGLDAVASPRGAVRVVPPSASLHDPAEAQRSAGTGQPASGIGRTGHVPSRGGGSASHRGGVHTWPRGNAPASNHASATGAPGHSGSAPRGPPRSGAQRGSGAPPHEPRSPKHARPVKPSGGPPPRASAPHRRGPPATAAPSPGGDSQPATPNAGAPGSSRGGGPQGAPPAASRPSAGGAGQPGAGAGATGHAQGSPGKGNRPHGHAG